MEATFIRVKFKPYIKKISKIDLFYTLEIIPVVSAVENIDKIEWKNDTHSIEYNVPVTYKILIKKEESNENSFKIYHSCIDLLSSTSRLNLELCASVIPRPISENFVFRNTNNSNDYISMYDVQVMSKIDELEKKPLLNVNKQVFLKEISSSMIPLYTAFSENIPNEVYCYNSIKSANNIQLEHNELKFSKDDEKVKNLFSKKNEYSTYKMPLPRANVKTRMSSNITLDIYKSFIASNLNYMKSDDIKSSKWKIDDCNDYTIRVRTLPEVRVANFIRSMERELLPTKMLLDDILNNFLSSNIYSLFERKPELNNNTIKNCSVPKDFQSNRVLYSVVFNE